MPTVAAAEGGPAEGRAAATAGLATAAATAQRQPVLPRRRFAQQSGHFRIGQCRQAFASTPRLFGGDGGLAPLLSFRHPLGNFRADGTAGSFCRRSRRCGRSRCRRRCRSRRAGLYWFTQQGGHFRIIQRGKPLRPRRACSAAMVDLLHLFPCATHLATSSLMPPAAAAGGAAAAGADAAGVAATGAGVLAGAAGAAAPPTSHGMGCPALSASISASSAA